MQTRQLGNSALQITRVGYGGRRGNGRLEQPARRSASLRLRRTFARVQSSGIPLF